MQKGVMFIFRLQLCVAEGMFYGNLLGLNEINSKSNSKTLGTDQES